MILLGRTLALIIAFTTHRLVIRHFLLGPRPRAANGNRRRGRVRPE